MKKFLIDENTLKALVKEGTRLALKEVIEGQGFDAQAYYNEVNSRRDIVDEAEASWDDIYGYLEEDMDEDFFDEIPEDFEFSFKVCQNGDAYCTDKEIIDIASKYGADAMDYINFPLARWYEANAEDIESARDQRARDDAADEWGERHRHPDLY